MVGSGYLCHADTPRSESLACSLARSLVHPPASVICPGLVLFHLLTVALRFFKSFTERTVSRPRWFHIALLDGILSNFKSVREDLVLWHSLDVRG